MPGRKGRLVQNETTKAWEWKEEGNEYRYGFNGKENDNEIKGDGNQIDYGMRIYDPRIGKFLSVDPLTKSYPMLTPYQYASNNPVQNIDIDGLEGLAGQLASPGKWHIPGDANDDGHYTKQEIKQGTKIMTKTGAVAFHGVLLFAAPQVGIPLTITFLTGAPTTPSPQAMAGNAESQALRQGEIALDEASAETTTATRGMSNGLTKANKGTAVQNTSNSAAMANGGNAPVNLSAREATWVENFISNKPSPNVGIFTESALSTKALRELSNKLGGVEVAQVFVKTKTGGYYNVFYGTPRSIEVPNFEGGTPYLINHVHPSGNNMPSKSDNLLLERLQEIQKQNGMPVQNSSQIVPIGSANRKFNTSSQTKGD